MQKMKNKLLVTYVLLCSITFAGIIFLIVGFFAPEDGLLCDPISGRCIKPQMKLVSTNLPNPDFGIPKAKRDTSVIMYLQASVKIKVEDNRGSGTICAYDPQTKEAYIISCGHLFSGNKKPNGNGTKHAVIDVFYKNNEKLNAPQSFQADVVCYSNSEDISIMKFKPDWEIKQIFAIAPVNYTIKEGNIFESTGCDRAEEVASYTVEVVKPLDDGKNLITKNNSPRPGRSGGGLLSWDGYFLAIVWGTSDLDGKGYGFYVPLIRIHSYLERYEQTKWLLKVNNSYNIINNIPIISPNGNVKKPPTGYIPQP